MECPNQREDASKVLEKVLGHLDQVVEHVSRSIPPNSMSLTQIQLRNKNEYDAANNIAKDTVRIVDAFNNATAPWDMDTFLMSPRTVHRPNPTLSKAGPQNGAHNIVVGGTWASVAAKPVDGKNHLIKYRPSDGVVRRYVEEEPAKADEDDRVIWVQGWEPTRPLATVTERVSQGPLLSMVYSEEYSAVCLIFQHASSAQDLMLQDAYHRQTDGYCVFGRGCNLVPGLPYPEDDDIRRMSHPVNERRRLTFARSQLFAHGMTEDHFKHDIFRLVGEGNVELVWLFNTGNGKPICHFVSRTNASQPPLSSRRLPLLASSATIFARKRDSMVRTRMYTSPSPMIHARSL